MTRSLLSIELEQLLHRGSLVDCESLATTHGCSVITVRRALRDVREALARVEHQRVLQERAA